MDTDFKPNTKKTCSHEHTSQTSAASQPAPAAASYQQLLLGVLFVLIGQLKYVFEQLRDDWFELQRMAHRIPNLMKRTSPIDVHDEGNKRQESHAQKQKQKEDKENNIKMVGQSSTSTIFCGICLDFKAESDMFRGKCKHPFCIDCISKHVATQIQQNVLKLNCPNPSCGVELKPEYLQSILPKEVIDRWESAKYESSIALTQKVYCPFKNCSGLLVNEPDGGKVVTSTECPYCHRLFCAQCKVPWHAEMSCKEFQKSKRNKGEKYLDKKFFELVKGKKWPKCPKCSFFVQRRGGCEHMTCRCGCNFCYRCGKNWKFGHVCK